MECLGVAVGFRGLYPTYGLRLRCGWFFAWGDYTLNSVILSEMKCSQIATGMWRSRATQEQLPSTWVIRSFGYAGAALKMTEGYADRLGSAGL